MLQGRKQDIPTLEVPGFSQSADKCSLLWTSAISFSKWGEGGLDWKMTKDTRSCKPTTDGHFPSFGRESKIVAHFLEGSDIHIL